MAKTFFFGSQTLRMSRMLSQTRADVYNLIRAKRLMRHLQNFTTMMATTEKSVWMQILSGLEKAFENVVVIGDSKKCVNSVNSTVMFFKTMQWSELADLKNVTTAINSTGDNFVNVVNDCTQGVNKIIHLGGVSIDFFKKLTGQSNSTFIIIFRYLECLILGNANDG